MARVFAVTSSIDRINPDAEGRCRVTFTVTNTGPEPLTARCSVVPEAPAEASWFQPVERPDRRLEPEATEQLVVELRIPTGAAAGDYSFRLDAVSEENPDEHYVEGPSVSFRVAASEEPQERPFPWWTPLPGPATLVARIRAVPGYCAKYLSHSSFGFGLPAFDYRCFQLDAHVTSLGYGWKTPRK